ncbi:MAG: M20 aminoacylase family protein [Pseudomonadota bacterium]
MPVINRIADYAADMTAWRRHIHARPELLFETHETAAFVAEQLRTFGVDEIHEGVATSGVVAVIDGQGPGPTIGLRADMDALPITETRNLPYRSERPGKMHACGHDGHTAMLLGAARYLAETRNFSGRVALLFQPAEEGGGGGKVMVDEGVMERYDITRVFALHNWPGLDFGRIELTAGPTMASGDQFDIEIRGRGAHAAYPHNSTDPIAIAMTVAQAMQTIVARTVNPLTPAVVSITRIDAGTTYNVIPEVARLAGTVRTLDEEVRQDVARRIEGLATRIAEGFGATAEVYYSFGYPVTVNDADAAAFAAEVARDVCGDASVRDDRRAEMGAEDFSYMLNAVPGAYVFLGQGDSAGLHHPEYDFNDAVAPIGASYLARLVERAQPRQEVKA